MANTSGATIVASLSMSKHVNGRKRQIMTDVKGRILTCRVHAANGHDGV